MNITEKLMQIQGKLKAPKNQRNSFGNYNYRSCEDILEAVKPFLSEVKCVMTLSDEMVVVGDRVYVKATATLTDAEKTGESISNTAFAREAETKKGQDESQITGATSSYARKYALNGLFLIDDNKDADTDEYRKETENKPKTSPKKAEKKVEPVIENDDPNTAEDEAAEKERRQKVQKEFVTYCKENNIDYKKYGLKMDSPTAAFEKAHAMAIAEVEEKNGGELPFPIA